MPSPNQKRSETDGLNLILFTIPQQIMLQMGTAPLLLAVVAGKAAAQTVQAIGQASEEVFRGDRLPAIEFPVETESESS